MPKILSDAQVKERIKLIIRLRARVKPMKWADVAREIGINEKSLYFFRARYLKETI